MSAESRSEVREKASVAEAGRSVVESGVVPPDSSIHAQDRKRRSVWWVWLVLLAAAGYGGYRWYPNLISSQSQGKNSKSGGVSAAGARAIPVVAVTARHGDMPVYINGLGTVTALNTVTVRSRVDGELMNVAYQEGQYVKAGDLLAEIDPRPFQVQLELAQGQLARDQAQLGQAQANLERDTAQHKYAQTEAERYARLVEQGIIARDQGEQLKSTADSLTGTLTADRAAIDSARAQMGADQATIDTAKLQLVYCRITSPLAGRIGLRLVDKGNIVHATDVNGLVVITQLQPIAVVFNIPEDSLRQVMPKFSAGVKFPVLAYDRDLRKRLADGMLLTIDNQVDPTTGTVKFKAVFENQDNALFPNQFVNSRLLFDTRHGAVIIPTAALQRSPQSTYVYVVASDHTVKMRNIVTTLTEGDNAAVDSGLEAGETIVVDGLDKLQDGTRVQVTMAPSQDKAQGKAQAPGQDAAQSND
jgi:multidrug efflux system membrane fusion protein